MQKIVCPKMKPVEAQKAWDEIIDLCKTNNLHRPIPAKAVIQISIWTLILFLGYYLAWTSSTWPVAISGCVMISFCMSQLAFWGHNAGHEAISRKTTFNRFLGHWSMGICCGLAFDEWKGRHKQHHRYVQQDDIDPDMIIDSVASVTVNSMSKKSGFFKKIGQLQHLYVGFLSLLFGHSQRILSQVGVLKKPVHYRRDLFVTLIHYCAFVILPITMGIPLSKVLIVYLGSACILGPHLAAVFWVNHIGMPLIRESSKMHNFEQQVVTSRTISNPKYLDWFYGGLNFQIEHHLYPSIPSCRLREMQSLVRPKIEDGPLDYTNDTWTNAIKDVFFHFKLVAKSK